MTTTKEDPVLEIEAPKTKKRGPLSFDTKLRALRDAKLAAVLKLAARELVKRQEHDEVQQQLATAQSELARAERALAEQPELPVAAQ